MRAIHNGKAATILATALASLLLHAPVLASNPKRALDLPVEFEFAAVPLGDVAEYLRDLGMVKVELGPGVSPKAPVTYRGKGRLDDQLRRLLAPLGLSYLVIDDRIVIQ
jgi:hypothetical protein